MQKLKQTKKKKTTKNSKVSLYNRSNCVWQFSNITVGKLLKSSPAFIG